MADKTAVRQSAAPRSAGFFTLEQAERLKSWTRRYPYPAMGLIEALRDVQDWHRRISPEAEAYLAELFQVPLHRIHEVATFYPYFTQQPTGKYRISVCRNLSCSLGGCGRVLEDLEAKLGAPEGRATPDGLFSFEAVECLGACDRAPAVAVNDELVGAGGPALVDRIIDAGKKGKLPDPAPLPANASPDGGRDARPPASTAQPLPAKSADGAPAAGTAKILTLHFDDPDLHQFKAYVRHGGYRGWEKAQKMSPAEIIEEVKKSNLRGLGGAGFPSGMKWGTVPSKKDRDTPHYLVANADESEPGCFKDRVLMERNPHALIEGLLIAGRAIDADGIFIFIRGEYASAARILSRAVDEAKQAGVLKQEIWIMRGANAYISGCDTALLETMEGKKAWPRQPPPFPTVVGVMGHPTLVHNVETLMMVSSVIDKGGDWFAKLGVPKCGGTAVFSISGHVARPGVFEFPMGTPLKTLIEAAGGVSGGRGIKAVIPGGTSTPVLTGAEAAGAKMDFESLRGLGTFLGAGGVVVLDETTDMVGVLHIIERFLAHESCGQCTPCREGSAWLERILRRILSGRGAPEDIDTIVRAGENITGKVICALGDTVGMVATSMIRKFRPEFEAHISAHSHDDKR